MAPGADPASLQSTRDLWVRGGDALHEPHPPGRPAGGLGGQGNLRVFPESRSQPPGRLPGAQALSACHRASLRVGAPPASEQMLKSSLPRPPVILLQHRAGKLWAPWCWFCQSVFLLFHRTRATKRETWKGPWGTCHPSLSIYRLGHRWVRVRGTLPGRGAVARGRERALVP